MLFSRFVSNKLFKNFSYTVSSEIFPINSVFTIYISRDHTNSVCERHVSYYIRYEGSLLINDEALKSLIVEPDGARPVLGDLVSVR